jgi:hypothetical protein
MAACKKHYRFRDSLTMSAHSFLLFAFASIYAGGAPAQRKTGEHCSPQRASAHRIHENFTHLTRIQ